MFKTIRIPLGLLALVLGGSACGGDDGTETGQDLTSFTTVTAVDRATISTGGIEMIATSFCGEQMGDGLELIVGGLQPSASVDATVNGDTLTFTAEGDAPVIKYELGTEPSYTVVVQTSNGTAELDVTGCQ